MLYLPREEIKTPFVVILECLNCKRSRLGFYDEGKREGVDFAQCDWCGRPTMMFVGPIVSVN